MKHPRKRNITSWHGEAARLRAKCNEVTITRVRYEAYQKCEAKLTALLEAAEAVRHDSSAWAETSTDVWEDFTAAIEKAREGL